MHSSFTDLVFTGERIEVGLKRGMLDYVAPAVTSNRRFGAAGAKKKEEDAHTVTSAPTWSKPQQTPHNTYQYAQHQLSFSARVDERVITKPFDNPESLIEEIQFLPSFHCRRQPPTKKCNGCNG